MPYSNQRASNKNIAYRGACGIPGFTLAELMVSIAILIIISLAVAGDITRTRFQEELNSSARLLLGTLRDTQAQALAVKGVKTCLEDGGTRRVCETGTAGCAAGTCPDITAPYAVGVTLNVSATGVSVFADVDAAFNDRRELANTRELVRADAFLTGNTGSRYVTVNALRSGPVNFSSATVTFERQNGRMRINACDDPPGAPSCAGSPEPTTLEIDLIHSRTNQIKTIRLNAITGKISLE
ncbi:hypothetical protein HS096_04320 [candidate division WWE3 bacterium]|uniref:Prepilin-type N-terminal cleavage/methylation domain-containing protein n=1 Tax=candidate division WWE3 bacterium TaxID=2053526 RepID=A0A928Y553_UNCKA|nr:hypothetical protein [candidate division WWE3 bacterium]